ncbi:MAG: DUF4856 domain-containing protein [Bacteroidia bacterium]
MSNQNTIKLSILLILAVFVASCSGNGDSVVEVPTHYEFNRDGASTVSYSGQTQRIAMLAELSTYAKTGTTLVLSEQTLLNMFTNTNSPFNQSDLNQEGESRKQIASKVYGQGDGLSPNDGGATQTYFKELLIELAQLSELNNQTASNGIAGIVSNGSSNYLVNAQGFEPVQLLEKGLMGALLFHQGTNVYLGEEKLSVSGSELAPEKSYTSLEHHFDEAYGYFDLPTDMSTFEEKGENGELKFWAKYAYSRNGTDGIGYDIANRLHDAYRNARACISAKYDMADKDYDCTYNESIETIKTEWELLVAANAIHYINAAQANLTNQGNICHSLSECIGFLQGLRYAKNGSSKLSATEIDQIEDLIGSNLWEVVPTNLTLAKNKIVAKYTELEPVKDQL